MMAQCYTDISKADMRIMEDSTAALSKIMTENGTVTWEEMNAFNIPTSDTSIDRMKLNHIRHWSEQITSEGALARYKAEKFASSQGGKDLAAAKKLIEKQKRDETKQQMANLAKIIKENERQIEKARFEALTSDEKFQEKKIKAEEKRTLAREKKEAKAIKEAEARVAYIHAETLVNGQREGAKDVGEINEEGNYDEQMEEEE